MRRSICLGSLLLFVSAIAGCGGDSYTAVMQDALRQMGKLHASYKRVESKDHIGIVEEEVGKITERLNEIAIRKVALPAFSKEMQERMNRKYDIVLIPIHERLDDEAKRILQFGGGRIVAEPMGIIKQQFKPSTVKEGPAF